MTNRVAELRLARGWSQAHLAQLLSITRQTVIGLEAGKTDPGLGLAFRVSWLFSLPIEAIFMATLEARVAFLNETWEYHDSAATALDEERVLKEMGAQAWEMTGFGLNTLHFRRPTNPDLRRTWEYHRLEGLAIRKKQAELERSGWLYAGSWMGVFHYFKRSRLNHEA